MLQPINYPGARRPDRRRDVDVHGLRLAVWEWGDEKAPPLLLAHGGFDFAGTMDGFAPLLADEGWRVVSWDQRGHGDSEHAVLYNWDVDVRDALYVLDSTTRQPVPFVGHSKGGSILMQLADAMPHRCSHLVNLDGLPSRRAWPDVADHERARLVTSEVTAWLEHRQKASTKVRRPGTIDELAERRQRMNPRLPIEWLRYLVPIGARQDGDGWRWKIDPAMRFGGFGPWRPEWSMMRMPGLAVPVLGVLGLEVEAMGWGTRSEDVLPWLPAGARFEALDGVGHFVHIEQPDKVAGLVLDFLGRPPSSPPGGWGEGAIAARPAPPARPAAGAGDGRTTFLTHNRSRLALHRLRAGDVETARPLLLLHGLGEHTPARAPTATENWPGPVYGLDFTGHGLSTMPAGGGYSAEVLLGDADTAVRHLAGEGHAEVTVLGRGLGAYVALLLSGARPDAVRGAILTDGPGMIARSTGPGSPIVPTVDHLAVAPPDPFALAELARDIRSPDYAAIFARMALLSSPLQHPIAVCSVNRPEWCAAVVDEPGVLDVSVAEAITADAFA
ncbi:MAG: alpha/beta fold hydrolase [Acidimicrobiales bacterium]